MTDKKLTKEEAQELYDDLSKAMSHMMMKRQAAMASAKVGSVQPAHTQAAGSAAKNTQASTGTTYTRQAVKRGSDSVSPSGTGFSASLPRLQGRGQMGAVAFVVLAAQAYASNVLSDRLGVSVHGDCRVDDPRRTLM